MDRDVIIAAVLARWPDMQPYISTAKVETMTFKKDDGRIERGTCVTVTVFDKGKKE